MKIKNEFKQSLEIVVDFPIVSTVQHGHRHHHHHRHHTLTTANIANRTHDQN